MAHRRKASSCFSVVLSSILTATVCTRQVALHTCAAAAPAHLTSSVWGCRVYGIGYRVKGARCSSQLPSPPPATTQQPPACKGGSTTRP